MGQRLQKQEKQEPVDIEKLLRKQIIENTITLEKKKLEPGVIDELKMRQVLEEAYPFSKYKSIYTKCQEPTKLGPQKTEKSDSQAQIVHNDKTGKVLSSKQGQKRIDHKDKWPYNAHGIVTMNFNGKKHWGVGTLIGPNIVLTAAHNIYDHQEKIFAELKTMEFRSCLDSDILPFGHCKIKHYFVTSEYVENEKEDYGLLLLEDAIGETTGYFGLAAINEQDLKTKAINITGYYLDAKIGKENIYEMWTWEGKASHIDTDFISYDIDGNGGQKGAGIWYKEDKGYFVVGVHVFRDNKGILITKERYQQIREWIAEASGTRLDHDFYESGYRIIELNGHTLGVDEVSTITGYILTNLEALRVMSLVIPNNEASQILLRNTTWFNLKELYLGGNLIGTEGAKVLAQNATWTKLSTIDLSSNNIDDEGVKALSQNAIWTNLTALILSFNKIGKNGAKALSQNTTWINLSNLNLSYNKIGQDGAKALAQNTTWTKLSYIDISSKKILMKV